MQVKMWTVDSTNIAAVGHRGGVLYVRFNTGAIYAYHGVSIARFIRLKNAASVGGYFHKHIRGNEAIGYERVA